MINFYIGTIQLLLFYLMCLVWWCELVPTFKNSITSAITRSVIAISLGVIGCYSHYLSVIPLSVVLAFFIITIASTFYVSKHIVDEYTKRKDKQYSREVEQ